MSNLLTGYPSRVITVSLGLLLFTLASLLPLLAQAPPSADTFVSSTYPTTIMRRATNSRRGEREPRAGR
jgi:hypothetical protein